MKFAFDLPIGFFGDPLSMLVIVCLFVCVDAEHPSQQCFSHVGTEPPLPGYNQYFSGSECVFSEGHNTAGVVIELETLPLGHRAPKLILYDYRVHKTYKNRSAALERPGAQSTGLIS